MVLYKAGYIRVSGNPEDILEFEKMIMGERVIAAWVRSMDCRDIVLATTIPFVTNPSGAHTFLVEYCGINADFYRLNVFVQKDMAL